MKALLSILALAGIAATAPALAQTAPKHAFQYGSMAGASLGAGASLNGAVPFPADNAWNTDISKAPVDPNSANLIASIPIVTTETSPANTEPSAARIGARPGQTWFTVRRWPTPRCG